MVRFDKSDLCTNADLGSFSSVMQDESSLRRWGNAGASVTILYMVYDVFRCAKLRIRAPDISC